MPLPIILGIGAGIAAATGIGTGINGGVKMKKASNTMKEASKIRETSIKNFTEANRTASIAMDELGKDELIICSRFEEFSDCIEKIQNRPEFAEIANKKINLPKYNADELKKVSVGASVLLGGVMGSALGTAGGFAAAGVTTSAVMALGTASTGTAISTLSGVAATNATLAALGGGAIAAGGGGMALGTTILGASTLGVGIMVGGIIFNITGAALSKKADKAYTQAESIERESIQFITFFNALEKHAKNYNKILNRVKAVYYCEFVKMKGTLNKKTNWLEFSDEEKQNVNNCVLLVGLLFNMCKVNLVCQAQNENDINTVNVVGITESVNNAKILMKEELNKDLAI